VIGANGNSVYDRLVTLMNRPDMKSDSAPRFASDATRVEAEGEINAVIEEYVSSLDAEEVIKNLEDARVPAGMIMTIEDVRTMDGWIDSREIQPRPALPNLRLSDDSLSPALTRSHPLSLVRPFVRHRSTPMNTGNPGICGRSWTA